MYASLDNDQNPRLGLWSSHEAFKAGQPPDHVIKLTVNHHMLTRQEARAEVLSMLDKLSYAINANLVDL